MNKGAKTINSIFYLIFVAVLFILLFVLHDGSKYDALIWQCVLTFLIYAVFCCVLIKRTGLNLIADIGFIYAGFIVLYTIIPAYNFFTNGYTESDPINQLSSSIAEVSAHLFRHNIFLFFFTVGYITFRGCDRVRASSAWQYSNKNEYVIAFLLFVLGTSLYILTESSIGATNYYESYMRYENLDFIPRKIVSIAIRFKQGVYISLLTFMFMQYRKYKYFLPIIVVFICLYEIVFSFGARIQAFLVLLQVIFLYNLLINKIKLSTLLIYATALGAIFSAIELFRLLNFDTAQELLFQNGIKPPWELSSVYYSGFHMYQERVYGQIPDVQWQMFFNDFINLVPFIDFPKWNPMNWYHVNYYAEALVPPYTLGPIADSAIWGGEIDLVFRGIINGVFFAFILRLFLKYSRSWWSVAGYTFLCANSIMTIKYSIFYSLGPVAKTLIPVFVIIFLFIEIHKKLRQNT
jgi:hypothetical protein